MTKAELQEEIDNLRSVLYQERQDFASNRHNDRRIFSEMLARKSAVKSVLKKRKDGNLEVLCVLEIEQANDGFTVIVG